MKVVEKGTTICVVCGNDDPSMAYFAIPKDEARRKLWLEEYNIDPSSNLARDASICDQHFTKNSFLILPSNGKRKILKKSALPSIHVSLNDSNHKYPWNQKPTGRKLLCFLCGSFEKSENRTTHIFPTVDIELRKKWLRNINKDELLFNLVANKRLCTFHFSDNDIIQHPATKKLRLRKGTSPIPIADAQTTLKSNPTPTSFVKIKDENDNDEDSDSLNSDVYFISSSSPNSEPPIIIEDESEESENSEIDPGSEPSQPRNPENIVRKESSSSSSISTSNKENVTPSACVDLTIMEPPPPQKKKKRTLGRSDHVEVPAENANSLELEQVQPEVVERDMGEKAKLIRKLQRRERRMKTKLADFENLINALVENEFVTKKGKKMIKKFKKQLD